MKTVQYPMAPIMRDESTTTNNIHILDDIYSRQLGSDRKMCPKNLHLIYGDLKTVKRILAVKAIRRGAENVYDRYEWLIPGLGLWHLRLNFLQMLHHVHWGGANHADPTTLQYAADRWQRHRVVQPNNFQALEDLIIHSYQSRICGVWLILARRKGLRATRIEDIGSWFFDQPRGSWSFMLDELAYYLDINKQQSHDPESRRVVDDFMINHRAFCAHVESYLMLKHAIKFADIGLLKYALRDCMVMFQAKESGAPQYARELIRLVHLTDSEASAPELQRAVLANSLVNLHGESGNSFETDRLLELLNNVMKYFQKERSSFVHDSERLLTAWALNGPFLAHLKEQLDRIFGKPNNPRHAKKAVYEQLLNMANELERSGIREQDEERFSLFPVRSLHREGLKRLSDNISRFNNDMVPSYIFTVDTNARLVSTDSPGPSSPLIPIKNLTIDPTLPSEEAEDADVDKIDLVD